MLNIWNTFNFDNTESLNQNSDLDSFQAKDDLWLKFAETISEQSDKEITGTMAFTRDILDAYLGGYSEKLAI